MSQGHIPPAASPFSNTCIKLRSEVKYNKKAETMLTTKNGKMILLNIFLTSILLFIFMPLL